LDSSVVQGPFSVAPCQTLISRFATFSSPAGQLHAAILDHPDAWPFLDAVDGREVTDYYEIIKDPVDLAMLKRRLVRYCDEKVANLANREISNFFIAVPRGDLIGLHMNASSGEQMGHPLYGWCPSSVDLLFRKPLVAQADARFSGAC
jgi:hypothetical protein